MNPRSSTSKERIDEASANYLLDRGHENIGTYTSALELCRTSAAQFIKHLQHLAQAQDAYEQATTASAKLRTISDARDASLRSLMTQIEQVLDPPVRKPTLRENEPDTATRGVFRPASEDRSVKKRFL